MRRMDVKNHNMNKEKPIMRKRLKVIAFLAFFLGIVLAVSQYFGFVSKTVYEESVSHLTEVFHQSDNMLRELSNKNLTYLHMWSKYLQDAPSESKIRDYIDKAQKDAGFLYFYFLLFYIKKNMPLLPFAQYLPVFRSPHFAPFIPPLLL